MKNILVIGSLNMDFVIEVDKMPQKGETLIGKNFTLIPGGKGANQAYAIGKLGSNVSMLGAIGDDEYGHKLLDNLNSVNVNTQYIQVLKNVPTGCAFVTVEKTGENHIVVISGANAKITEYMIQDCISLIEKADIVVLQLEIPLEIVTLAAEIAHQKGKLVVLDPAPAVPNLSEKLLSFVDILKPNETEIQILTGKKIVSDEDLLEAAKILLTKGVKNVIVTLGNNGSLLVNTQKTEHFPALPVNAIDTTAAGDSFTAALTTSLLEGTSIEDAIKFGHIVSSIVVTKKGAQTSIPDKLEVTEFLKKLEKETIYGKDYY